MRLILMGPPGAGKGTQAARLARRFGLAHISSGDLLRAQQRAATAMGAQVAAINEGHLAPEAIVRQLVVEQLDRHDDFVLDGVPRTLENAEWLHARLPLDHIDAIFLLKVRPGVLRKRIAARFEVEQRPEDAPIYFDRRYDTYCRQTKPVAERYRRLGRLIEVNGDLTVYKVTVSLRQALAAVKGTAHKSGVPVCA